MTKKINNKIPQTIDYNKVLNKYSGRIQKIIFHIKQKTEKIGSEPQLAQATISLKIETCEHIIPLGDVSKICDSVEIIIKNIAIALGYNQEDISLYLAEAGSGCFLLKFVISLTSGAVQKYSTGFIEGLLNKNLEKEGKRQAEMIKKIFQDLVSVPKFKNANSEEAKNIQNAKKLMYMTFDNNKKIKSINFTDNPNKKVPRGTFMDYIV